MKARYSFPPLPVETRIQVHDQPRATDIVIPWRRNRYDWFRDIFAIVLTVVLYVGFRQFLVDTMGGRIWVFDSLLGVVLLFNVARLLFFVLETFKGRRMLRFDKHALHYQVFVPGLGLRHLRQMEYRAVQRLRLTQRQGLVLQDRDGNDLSFGTGLEANELEWLKNAVETVLKTKTGGAIETASSTVPA